MPESKDSFQEKTEKPTGRRRQESRRKGQVAKSQDINASLVLLAGLAALSIWGGYMLSRMMVANRFIFTHLCRIELTPETLPGYFLSGALLLFSVLAPVVATILLVGIAANLLQTGWLLSAEPIRPKLSNLNPMKGLKRLGSKRSAVELLKGVLKLFIVGWVGYTTLAGLAEEMIPLMDRPVWDMYRWICGGAAKVGYRTILALVILGLIDLIYQRWDHLQSMKMTKQEVKDEHRQAEGDPQVKSRIRSIQLKTALRRMRKDVHKADVVITNPTEIAIALRYDPATMTAPVVLAKGKRKLAARIRQIALEHDIPIVENKPLAQALYKGVEVGQEVPGNFYQAVAEILAYVYRLRGDSYGNYH
ncbi:MAG: flagellar biosynthesis protein FlhB [Candidatus Zixiibacteriota bacterium]|nr:MAG: flagellar biosynthesis protein FlhB [candidate division Zixibacteria bacterium]